MRLRTLAVHGLPVCADRRLTFGEAGAGGDLHILYGPNEAGKSSLLQAVIDLLYGGPLPLELRDRYTSETRLAAELEHSQFPPFSLQRRRRYHSLVLETGTEEAVHTYLGGVDRERYVLLFGLDAERLRHGGERLLQAQGHAGISLFEAGSGVQSLQQLRTRLAQRAEQLLDPAFRRNSARLLNRAAAELQAAEQAVRAAALPSEHWQALRDDLVQLERRYKEVRARQQALAGELSALQRVQRVRGLVSAWQTLQARRAELQVRPLLPLAVAERAAACQQELAEVVRASAHWQQELARLAASAAGLVVDESVLAHADVIRQLLEGLQQFEQTEQTRLPRLMAEVAQLRAAAEQRLRALAPRLDWSDVEQLRLPLESLSELRQLLHNAREWTQRQASLQEQQTQLLVERQALVTEQEALAPVDDVARLRQAWELVRQGEEAAAQAQRAAAEVERREGELVVRLARQGLYQGALADVATRSIPLRATLDRWQEAWAQAEERRAHCERERDRVLAEEARVQAQLAALEGAGRVPAWEDVLAARSERETGWALVRQVLQTGKAADEALRVFAGEQPLWVAYEAAVQRADALVDELYRAADRAGQRDRLLQQQHQLAQSVAQWDAALAAAEAEQKRLAAAWRAEWAASGIQPLPPAEMKGWLTEHWQPLLEGWHTLLALRSEAEDAARRCRTLAEAFNRWASTLGMGQAVVEEAVSRLHAAAAGHGREPALAACSAARVFAQTPGDWPLLAADAVANPVVWQGLRNQLEALREAAEQAARRRAAWQSRWQHWEQRQQTLAVALQQVERAGAAWAAAWQDLRRRCPSLPEHWLAAEEYVEQVQELFRLVDELAKRTAELQQLQAQCAAYRSAVTGVAEQLEGMALAEPVGQWLRRAGERVRAAVAVQAQQQAWQTAQAQAETQLRQAQARRSELERTLAELAAPYGGQDLAELQDMVERTQLDRQLAVQSADLEHQLQAAGDGLPAADLAAAVVQAPDVDAVAQRLRVLGEELAACEQEQQAVQEQLAARRHELAQWTGQRDDAAQQAQLAEAKRAELAELWQEYVRVELARRLLERAVEVFRERNEGAVLARASAWLARLTLGRYRKLTVEYEGSAPYLQAERADGLCLRVPQLSDGTRDQLFLALRLAFVERHNAAAEPLPLVLDDVLVHFDDQRTRAALAALAELAGQTQVLYFTHHREVVTAAQALTDTHRVYIHELG
ncbi:MAG: AAA family ATPase [Alicyclobacillus sp.]|nr:AAA family ATPase [Alicyclobacillus sp.]